MAQVGELYLRKVEEVVELTGYVVVYAYSGREPTERNAKVW